MRCTKPPPVGWRTNEWTVLGGRQSGGISSIPGCGGELYHFGEYVGILAVVDFEVIVDHTKPVVLGGESFPRMGTSRAVSLAYVPAIWYLVG